MLYNCDYTNEGNNNNMFFPQNSTYFPKDENVSFNGVNYGYDLNNFDNNISMANTNFEYYNTGLSDNKKKKSKKKVAFGPVTIINVESYKDYNKIDDDYFEKQNLKNQKKNEKRCVCDCTIF